MIYGIGTSSDCTTDVVLDDLTLLKNVIRFNTGESATVFTFQGNALSYIINNHSQVERIWRLAISKFMESFTF
jgi:hypothetical protein